jgi:trehalose-phosphatase
VHWRQAPDTDRAAGVLEAHAIAVAHDMGLVTRGARMAIELRPPLPFDKGSAVRALLRERPCARSLYAGDDVTDIDAFAVVDVAVAVVSDEAPPGLVEAATLAVGDAPALLARL